MRVFLYIPTVPGGTLVPNSIECAMCLQSNSPKPSDLERMIKVPATNEKAPRRMTTGLRRILRSRIFWSLIIYGFAFLGGAMWVAYDDLEYDRAVWHGEPSQVRLALESEPTVNRLITRPNFEAVLRKVLGLGPVFNLHPMQVASIRGRIDVAQELIRHGAQVDGTNGAGATALSKAAYKGDIRMCQYLLDVGADPNSRYKDGTPAHEGATPEVLRLFLSRGIRLER